MPNTGWSERAASAFHRVKHSSERSGGAGTDERKARYQRQAVKYSDVVGAHDAFTIPGGTNAGRRTFARCHTRAERMAKDPKPDLYAILGVHPGAEDIVIRAAFKALAQRYHPDRFSGAKDEAHRRMSDLTAAYEVLADPIRRRRHDRHRYIYARIASLHGKDPPIGKRLGSAVIDRVSVAVKQQRYRVALSTLMVTVVVLSTFNVYQYSDRLREMLKTSPSAPAAESKIVDAPPTPISLMQGTLPTGAPANASAANVSPPPTRATITAATVGPAKPRTETKPPGTKPAASKNTPARRPDAMPPVVAVSESCSDVVVALGLCTPNSTGKKK